jgi:hypothetical protein
MDANVVFLDCPAYMDRRGTVRCGLPAEVDYIYTMRSTDGPLESAKIRCPLGHTFNGPIEVLCRDILRDTSVPSARFCPGRSCLGSAFQQRQGRDDADERQGGDHPPAVPECIQCRTAAIADVAENGYENGYAEG